MYDNDLFERPVAVWILPKRDANVIRLAYLPATTFYFAGEISRFHDYEVRIRTKVMVAGITLIFVFYTTWIRLRRRKSWILDDESTKD